MPLMRRAALVLLPCSALAGCGLCGADEPPPPPPPPLPPTIVSLTLKAAADVNAETDGTGRPVQVRILTLASAGDFMEADFFALDGDLAGTLGKALLGEEKLTLGPSQIQVWQREFGEEARFIGVMAAYRDIGAASWRAFAEVPRNQTTLLDANLGPDGVRLAPSGL
jgi:type VI secretion system protein VasD